MEHTSTCGHCNQPVSPDEKFCTNCGYPANGTEREQRNFYIALENKKNLVKDSQKKIRNVKIMLGIIATIQALAGFFYLFSAAEIGSVLAIIQFVAVLLILGCIIWVNHNPLTGIMAAFVVYILLVILSSLGDPVNLVRGLLWKIIIIGIFIKGIAAARDAKEFASQIK